MRYVTLSRRPSARRRRSAVLFDALEPRALFTAAPTTTALSLSSPIVGYTQTVTFTASVTAAGAPVAAGSVAFIQTVATNYLYNQPVFSHPVFFNNPDTGSVQVVDLLATAPLNADGTAAFVQTNHTLADSSIRAVFLGSSPLLSADPGRVITFVPTSPTLQSNLPAGDAVVYPSGHAVQLDGYSSRVTLSYLPDDVFVPDAVTLDPAGLSLPDFSSELTLSPSDTPYLIHTITTTTQEAGPFGTYTRYHNAVTITPFTGLPDYPGQNDDYLSSLSGPFTLAPDQPTTLHLSTAGPFTYTNPLAITVSLSNPAGISYSRHTTSALEHGTYQEAHAGLDVQVSTGGTSDAGLNLTNGSSNGSLGGGTTLHPFVPAGPFPTGTVSFFDENNALLGTADLDSEGNATFYPDPRSLSLAGSHSIHAVYAGDANYQPADASTDPFTLSLASTSVSVTGLPSAITAGDTLSLRATATTSTRDTITPTGTFTFSVDGQPFATLPALASDTGSAVPQLPLTLSAGTHTVTIAYSGDADFLPSSTSKTVTVSPSSNTGTGNDPTGGVITDVSPAFMTPNYSPGAHYVPGDTLSFDAHVLFTGSGSTGLPNRPVTFAISADDVVGNADDIPLNAQANLYTVGTLNFDASHQALFSNTYSATLPTDLAPGTYQVVAILDPDNAIAETDESNNSFHSFWTFTVSDPTAPPVDITPAPVTPDLAGSLTPARPTITLDAPASLKLTLTNPSKTKSVTRKYTVTYYLSDDATFSNDDTKFSRQTITATLAKKQTRSYTLSYKLPKATPLGTRYLIAVADAPAAGSPATAHLELASSKPLKILGPHLTATIRSVTPTNRPDTVKVTIRVLNDGSAPFAGPATLRLLSDTPNSVLLTARKSINLKTNKYTDYTFTVRRPTGSALSATIA